MEKLISDYEELIFAKDANVVLNTWKQSGDNHKLYLRMCHLIERHQTNLPTEDKKVMEVLAKNSRYGEFLNVILKYNLLKIKEEKDEEKKKKLMKEFNDEFLRYDFSEERPNWVPKQTVVADPSQKKSGKSLPPVQTGLKTSLTKEELTNELGTEFLIKDIQTEPLFNIFDLREASQSFLRRIDLASVKNSKIILDVLDTLDDFVYNKVVSYYIENVQGSESFEEARKGEL
jgi:CRISPR/Cas system-associated endonuclease/helicase Cas3